MKQYGTFHLGYLYNIEATWTPAQIFACEEQDEKDEELFHPRRLVITPSAILLFEQHKHLSNMGMLIAWATSHSLDRVRRNVTVRPELLSLIWRPDIASQSKPWTLNLFVTQGRHNECVNCLIKNMENLGVGVEKVVRNQTKIKESEVTKEAIAQMDIDQILGHINDYEEEVGDYDLSISTI